MKKGLAILLAFVMILSLTACGTSGSTATTAAGTGTASGASASGAAASGTGASGTAAASQEAAKNLIVGLSNDPETFGPWERFNNGRRDALPMVYQTLTSDVVDPKLNKVVTYYVMISGYKKLDKNTYELKLREGIYDTAGNAFKAEDAIFTFETAKKSGKLSQLNAVDSLKLVDEYTFQIVTGRALAIGDFEDLLSAINMVTKKSYEASPDGMATTPVGTTGYKLKEYVSGSKIVYEKADKYWNQKANDSKSTDDGYCFVWDNTKLDSVQFEVITDTSTMAVALETGKIDISSNVAKNDMVLFKEGGKDAKKFNVFTYPDNMYSLSYNCSKKSVCSNLNLRLAIAYCFDAQAALDAAYDGDGVIAKAWSYPSFADYQKKWDSEEYFSYNLDKAKKYLQAYFDESGTKAADLKIRLLIYSKPSMVAVAQVIQAYISDLVGNPNCCEILNYDQSTYNKLYVDDSAFDAFIYATQNNRTYSTYAWNQATNIKKTTNGQTQWFESNDELQKLLQAAISVDTHSDQTVSDFQDYINKNCYVKGMLSGNVYVVGANWIKSLEMGPKNCLAICALDYDWAGKSSWAK